MSAGGQARMTAQSVKAPVLSVIIPVYNEAQTIGRILQQVVRAVAETTKQIINEIGTIAAVGRNARLTRWNHEKRRRGHGASTRQPLYLR
jgi:hypothetical protein